MDSKKYEILIGELIESLSKREMILPLTVKHLEKFNGKSGEIYEIDISYKFRLMGIDYQTVVECKYWNKNVGRDKIAAFKAIIEDIGAHKGAVVTTVGFQKGAIGLAAKSGIALLKVSDIENPSFHAIQHFEGKGDDIIQYLLEDTPPFSGKGIKESEGFTTCSKHIIDYVYEKYGKEVATFLHSEEVNELKKVPEGDFKKSLINQIETMPNNWISDFLKLESCGLPIIVEPEMELRIINLKLIGAKYEIEKIR